MVKRSAHPLDKMIDLRGIYKIEHRIIFAANTVAESLELNIDLHQWTVDIGKTWFIIGTLPKLLPIFFDSFSGNDPDRPTEYCSYHEWAIP